MASLKDLIVMGPARFLDKLYGNLEGNATTADQWKTARTFTIGSKGWKVSGDNDVTWTHEEIGAIVSNTWTGGTTAGPTLSTTVNGVTGGAVAIPSASSSASGIVTVGDQSFRGMKTFYGAVRGYMYNLNNNAPAFLFDKPSSHWTGIGACGENDTIFFGPCTPDSNVAGGYSWVANYNQKWKFQGDIYTTNLINAAGTITSASTITGNRFVISNSSSAAAHIEFSRVGWNYIISPSGSSIAISPNGSTGDSNARLVIESAAVYPGANNGTVDLGKSNYKWNNVYGNNFSGNAASASWLNTNSALVYGNSGLQYFNLSGTAGTDPKTNNTPTSDWHHIIRMNHNNKNGYFADIAVPLNNTNGIYWRQIRNGTNYGWYTLLDSNNYTSYTVKKDGTGASGTWGISISGNAATATKATQDGNGATISSTYLKLSGGTMSGRLTLNTSVTDHADPMTQILCINCNGVPSGTTLTDKNAPGIGFHIGNNSWGSLILNGGNFKFINNNATGYMPVYASTFYGNLSGTATKATQDGSGNTITSTYLKLSGGTMNTGAQIIRAGAGTSWIYGRDKAIIRMNSISGWDAAISVKTNNGSWDIGVYDASSYADKLVFSYTTDTNYSSGNNTSSVYTIDANGYFSGTCSYASSAGSANSVAWGNVTGKPSTFAPSSHTHSYLPLSGGTMTGAISITTNGVTNSFYSQNSSFTHYSTSASTGHWFNKSVYVAGEIYAGTSYNQRVYHMGNIVYGSEPTSPATGTIWLVPV